MPPMLEPISLGYACDVKYQASRNLYFRTHPGAPETEFRGALFRSQGQQSPFRRHIFDWMITPFDAVCAYLERDFQGVLERRDLAVGKNGTTVMHAGLDTWHPHDFRAGADGQITEAMIDTQYPAFAAKYAFLAQRFRDLLATPGPYLYIYREIVTQRAAQRLAALLQARSPDHHFQLLFVDTEGAVNQVMTKVGAPAFKGWLPPGCAKPPDRQWEGDDAAWDAVLDRFDLGRHGSGPEHATRAEPATETASTPPTGPTTPPPALGWRDLLAIKSPTEFAALFDHVSANGKGAGLVSESDRIAFASPDPEDHFFCQFLPTPPLPGGGWARLTLGWPASHHPRAGVALQDQDCVHPAAHATRTRTVGGGVQETTLLPLPCGADHVRLVVVPGGLGRSDLPVAIKLEVVPAKPAGKGAGRWRAFGVRGWTGRRRSASAG